jgi:hypothetical protein
MRVSAEPCAAFRRLIDAFNYFGKRAVKCVGHVPEHAVRIREQIDVSSLWRDSRWYTAVERHHFRRVSNQPIQLCA